MYTCCSLWSHLPHKSHVTPTTPSDSILCQKDFSLLAERTRKIHWFYRLRSIAAASLEARRRSFHGSWWWCSKKLDFSAHFDFPWGPNGDFKLCANSLGIACHRFIRSLNIPIESSWNVCLWKPTIASWHPTLASPWHPYRIDSANVQKTRGTPSKERDEVGDDFCDPKGLKQTEW